MKFNFEKDTRIISDVMEYCHNLGALDYHIDMKTESGVSKIHVRCTIPNVSEEVLSGMKWELNLPRQKEIEQEFWGLSGDDDTEAELALVGMMIDEAEVTYEDGVLTLDLIRLE